jgi:crotonobetainyl-CoA:carnitine CoA-transferase CaiB-like acyl-CoA transferase
MLIEQEHPVLGKIQRSNLPFRSSGYDVSTPIAAPLLGQHNRTIAATPGHSDAAIDAMVTDGVLYAEPATAGT